MSCILSPFHEVAKRGQIQNPGKSKFSALCTLEASVWRAIVCTEWLYIRMCKWQMRVATKQKEEKRDASLRWGGPSKLWLEAYFYSAIAYPVSAEQDPVKHKFSSAEFITSWDLKMYPRSVLIEHTKSMNIKLFGCEIISTKLVMFNLTVEWRFSNLGPEPRWGMENGQIKH